MTTLDHETRLRVACAFQAQGWLVEGGPGGMVTREEDGAEVAMLTDPMHVWRAEGDPEVVRDLIAEARRIFEGAVS